MFKDHFGVFTVIITYDSTWHIIFLQCTSSKRGGKNVSLDVTQNAMRLLINIKTFFMFCW